MQTLPFQFVLNNHTFHVDAIITGSDHVVITAREEHGFHCRRINLRTNVHFNKINGEWKQTEYYLSRLDNVTEQWSQERKRRDKILAAVIPAFDKWIEKQSWNLRVAELENLKLEISKTQSKLDIAVQGVNDFKNTLEHFKLQASILEAALETNEELAS